MNINIDEIIKTAKEHSNSDWLNFNFAIDEVIRLSGCTEDEGIEIVSSHWEIDYDKVKDDTCLEFCTNKLLGDGSFEKLLNGELDISAFEG